LAPEVVVLADGGGVVPAARRPVKGAERVASLLLRGLRTVAFEAAAVWLNGSPAIRIDARTAFNAAVSVVVEDGRITHIYVVANPQELARLDGITPLTRS
jgi:RNA polymerase sigma-70 factor (ECF subfamily)